MHAFSPSTFKSKCGVCGDRIGARVEDFLAGRNTVASTLDAKHTSQLMWSQWCIRQAHSCCHQCVLQNVVTSPPHTEFLNLHRPIPCGVSVSPPPAHSLWLVEVRDTMAATRGNKFVFLTSFVFFSLHSYMIHCYCKP